MSVSMQKFSSNNIFENSKSFHRTQVAVVDNKKKNTLKDLHFRRESEVTNTDREKAVVGSAIGMLLPTMMFAKKQNKSLLKMKYGFKEMSSMSVGANVGSVALNSIGKPKNEQKKKRNEGIFQIFNSVIPMACVDGALKACEKSKKTNNIPTKVVASALGVLTGSQIGIKISNKVTDPKDKDPDRIYSAKDTIANFDDAISMLVLAKVPFADKIHAAQMLPFIYTYSGYRSGTSN